ncbi:MAG: right-handed parallel beta-helix repeat-containing protein [Muribaculaceae bacterium]|nr:right-handed parallel beta-helix repeat-containing protein [Muribaculaceae bacterium]
MKKIFITLTALAAISAGAAAQSVYHVAVTGNDNGAGSLESPFATIAHAIEVVNPGETIYVHGGTYYLDQRIRVPEKATDEKHRINLWAYGDGEVILDGSKVTPKSEIEFKQARCMYFPYWANYWHVKGLTFQNAWDNGVKVEGSYNIFERCVFRGNNDTGLQIGMFKDWSIEETKSFPITGTPAFNPGYTYCRGNKVINCDSYNNYDKKSFSGSDDGGDADGFACKLFPGPGTEFIGCRAWNNSDDNWDLYMVYHPVVISNCWAWNAAFDENDRATNANGNGFKLGGGGSSGGAAFSQSVGAHVVYNCVAFNNAHKGFDQNNAYEGMYLFNNLAWGNEFNYRFPTIFEYGGMYIRNCVGFNATKQNHEFLSATKDGYQEPNTAYNSWTTIDGCDPVKDGNKVGKDKVYAADHSGDFLSLSVADAKAERLPDGSLPENNFGRLRAGSVFIDAGEIIKDFTPVRFMTEAEAAAHGIELITAEPVTIDYNGKAPDMGAFESGQAADGRLYAVSGPAEQTVYIGTAIEPIVVKWGGAATDVKVDGIVDNLKLTRDMESKTLTIDGTLNSSTVVTITTIGGELAASLTYTLNASTTAPATIVCSSGNQTQLVFYNHAIEPIVFEAGGGATGIVADNLPNGLKASVEGLKLTISGYPAEEGSYTVTATGGMTPVSISGSIKLEEANRVLTGDWYHIDEPLESVNEDLKGVVSIESSSNYKTVWDPTYTESGSVPGGCTAGAVNVERGGALVWNLPSIMELKANVHFTGGRYLQVSWKYDDEATEHTWTSSKLSKTTLVGWDLLAEAGIEPSNRPVTVKFVNPTSNNGGIRVYDFFVRVYTEGGNSGIDNVTADMEDVSLYVTDGALIINTDNIAGARLYSTTGRVVAQSIRSQIVPLSSVARGNVYLLQVLTTDGRNIVKKVVIK